MYVLKVSGHGDNGYGIVNNIESILGLFERFPSMEDINLLIGDFNNADNFDYEEFEMTWEMYIQDWTNMTMLHFEVVEWEPDNMETTKQLFKEFRKRL